MDTNTHPSPKFYGLQALLEESEADLAAGHVVPIEPVLDRMRASIARMESQQAGGAPPSADH